MEQIVNLCKLFTSTKIKDVLFLYLTACHWGLVVLEVGFVNAGGIVLAECSHKPPRISLKEVKSSRKFAILTLFLHLKYVVRRTLVSLG